MAQVAQKIAITVTIQNLYFVLTHKMILFYSKFV